METYKLTYFDLPARAETARILFALAEQEFEDIKIQRQDWPELKSSTPFGQVPLLEVGNLKICQSHAISRFLARKFGYAGKTEVEQAQVDMVAMCIEDMVETLRPIYKEQDETKKESLRKELYEPMTVLLKKLENLLASNPESSGYFVGKEMTWADVHMFTRLEFPRRVGVDIDWTPFPQLKSLVERVGKHPKIAAWIESRQVKPVEKLRITYFDTKGRAEVSRLILALADQPFEDVRITSEEFKELKPKLPFGQLPILEVDEKVICQSLAMHRYLAKRFGFAGRNDKEEAKADMLVECIEDFVNRDILPVFIAQGDEKEKLRLKLEQDLAPLFLDRFQGAINQNDEFFVGNALTWCDIAFYSLLAEVEKQMGVSIAWSKYPKLKAVFDKVSSNPKIIAWNAKFDK